MSEESDVVLATVPLAHEDSLPPAATRPRTIAVMNQKGGVGKTTTTANIGAALGHAGQRVLLIDLDPQAHLTIHFGLDPAQLDRTVYHLLVDEDVYPAHIVQPINEHLCLLPAEVNLAGVEAELAPQMVTGRAQRVLWDKLVKSSKSNIQSLDNDRHREPINDQSKPEVRLSGFDYCLIDCPPSLGLLTINALTLASEILVPMQAHFLALQGLSKLLDTVGLVRQSFNRDLSVTGIILCMYDGQTILANEVVEDLRTFLSSARDQDVPWRDTQILNPPVRRNIKLAECPSFGQTIFDYAPSSHGADDYRGLARTLHGNSDE